ncbi:hypothetical protein CF336_g9470, partial [Tilletia laevis]
VPVALPTLDPPSLYAASLLRLLPAHEQHALTLATPSALLHATVPRLEFSDSHAYAARTDALHGIRPIETYARTPNAAQQRPSIDDALRSTPLLSSRATALHAVLTHQLEPITLHALFSHQHNFAALAVPTYTYSPGQKAPSSWGAKVGMVLGAPVQSGETRTRKGRRLGKPPAGGKQDGPARVRAGEKDAKIGLKGSSRKEIVIGWERAKLTSIAEGSLDVLNAALEQDLNKTSWLLGTSSPTSLDAHLFSVIAPVLLLPPRSADKLGASTPMASLLRTQYPALVAHTTRLAQRLWAVQPVGVEGGPSASASASAAETQWEWKSTETQRIHVARNSSSSSSSSTPSSVSLSAAAGYLASSALSAPVRAWSSMRSYIYPRRAARPPPDSSSSSTASSLLRPENLGWGRIIWISSAVVGVVSFIFVTGLIQIEIVDV